MTQEVIQSGGLGVTYWEPAWVSSECYTQWGQGSHQEHAAFFDFENNLLIPGGVEWLSYDYNLSSAVERLEQLSNAKIHYDYAIKRIKINQLNNTITKLSYAVIDTTGKTVLDGSFKTLEKQIALTDLSPGAYFIVLSYQGKIIQTKRILFQED